MSSTERSSRAGRIALGAAVWLLIAGFAALQLAPHVPRTVFGWIVFVVIMPPLCFVAEMVSEKYMSDWGEHNALQKALKASAIVVALLLLMAVAMFFGA